MKMKKSKLLKGLCAVSLAACMLTVGGSAGAAALFSTEAGTLVVSAAEEAPGATYGSFEYGFNDDGTVGITKYNGSETDIVIPETIDGKSVTFIGYQAFSRCTDLTSVIIPDSVTYIRMEAFAVCKGLKSVTFHGSVISIGMNAFYGCSNLSNIVIPDSVEYIRSDSTNPFVSTKWWSNQPDGDVYLGKLYYKYKGTMPSGTSVTIRQGTKGINWSAFSGCTGLTSVTIPNSVSFIGGDAFYGCTGLTSVAIPNSVTSIGDFAFKNCSNLTSIVIPNSVEEIGRDVFYATKWYDDQPDGDVYIGRVYYRYKGAMPSNTTVTIRQGARGIAGRAFYDTGLTSVTIPNSVTSIGNEAFERCIGLTSVTIPNSVTSIGQYAFYGCTGLTSVVIPNSVTFIGQYAFNGCTGLTGVTIPNSITSIEDRAFCNTGLTDIAIPNSVTSIGEYAFYGCSGLTSVLIPDSVTSIGYCAFNGCTDLEGVTIPNSVIYIGNAAFSNCTRLTSVTIPDSMVYIAYAAFRDCTGLTSVSVPASLTTDADEIFSNTALNELTIRGNVDTVGQIGYLSGISCKKVTVEEGVKELNGTFNGLNGLTEIILPDSLEKIGDSAFRDCTGLERITIPASVMEIDATAFDNCSWITIYGVLGSVAESFAKEHYLDFVAINVPLENISTLSADTIMVGDSVTVNCSATGGTAPYTYAVYYRKAGSTKWTTAQGYKSNATVSVKPGAAIDYEIRVAAKDSEGTIIRKDMLLSVKQKLTNTSKLGADSITLGSKVKVRCFAKGGTGEYQYAVYVKKSTSEKWSKVRDYGTSNIIMYKPASAVSYDVRVDIKDSSGTVASKTLTLTVTK